MTKTHSLAAATAVFLVVASSLRAEQSLPDAELHGFFAEYRFQCHGEKKKKADLDLQALLKSGAPVAADTDLWREAAELLAEGEMPPEKKPQPSNELRAAVIADLEARLKRFDAETPDDPGRPTVRRLNRAEYNNTIRDLLGIDFRPADGFPADEITYGFDNIGDALSLSPVLMEKYLDAAEQIAERAIVVEPPRWPPARRIAGPRLEKISYEQDQDNLRVVGSVLGLYRNGEARMKFDAPRDGEYVIRVRAHEDRAGPEHALLGIRVDDQEVQRFDVLTQDDKPAVYSHRHTLNEGTHTIAAAYLNNYVVNNSPNRRLNGDRNLFVAWVEVQGPIGQPAPPMPEPHRRVIPETPPAGKEKEFALRHLRSFASRAWRRPASDAEAERLGQLATRVLADGEPYNRAMQVALQAILVSPNFLFRWELDPRPGGVRELNGHELAARLSYFLWSSMPDQQLADRAADGSLLQADVLRAETLRMLRDPKAEALVDNFGGQWLQTRNLRSAEPDPEIFPDFDDALRDAMIGETGRFFAAIMQEDRSVLEFLDADFTFLNERLARHYGIEGVSGENFRRVSLKPEHRRGGVLGQASVLTLTSHATRTSPVNRGKWVLDQLLGTPPPPPPDDVPPLPEGKAASESASLRERLEQHRANPDCAGCHAKMDPIGFALENYDAIGRWRDLDGKFPIDPSGELPGGEKFRGLADLQRILSGRDDFVKTVADKVLVYALGRGTTHRDRRARNKIIAALKANEFRFSTLITETVLSDPFRRRNTE